MKKSTLLLSVIQTLSKKIRQIKEQEFQQFDYQDLSAASIHYIDVISTMHNPTFVELANKLGLSKPSVTIMINKLIEKGYLQKTRSHEDGRVFYITLTEQGRSIANALNDAHHKVVEHISTRLSGREIETLIALLTKIS
ncbi:MAG: MarR family transcriptional regulator [Desulfobacteraceae bacterium]|jgi:DNA-binding MarR family transcriptional regulator